MRRAGGLGHLGGGQVAAGVPGVVEHAEDGEPGRGHAQAGGAQPGRARRGVPHGATLASFLERVQSSCGVSAGLVTSGATPARRPGRRAVERPPGGRCPVSGRRAPAARAARAACRRPGQLGRRGGRGLHDGAHVPHRRRPRRRHGVRHDGVELLLAHGGGQVGLDEVGLGRLGRRAVGRARPGVDGGGVAPLLHLGGQDPLHLLVGELARGRPGLLGRADGGDHLAQRVGPEGVACLHRRGQLGRQSLEGAHATSLPYRWGAGGPRVGSWR